MSLRHNLKMVGSVLAAAVLLAGCGTGTASMGSFDRTYEVTGPIRLDLANASGAVRITGNASNKVHIHGEIRAHGFLFNDPDKRNRQRFAEIGGVDPDLVMEQVYHLDQYQALYIKRTGPCLCVVNP